VAESVQESSTVYSDIQIDGDAEEELQQALMGSAVVRPTAVSAVRQPDVSHETAVAPLPSVGSDAEPSTSSAAFAGQQPEQQHQGEVDRQPQTETATTKQQSTEEEDVMTATAQQSAPAATTTGSTWQREMFFPLSPTSPTRLCTPVQRDFKFSYPFDANGVIYHIATMGGTIPYQNPHITGHVHAKLSSTFGRSDAKDVVEHFTPESRRFNACYTMNESFSWAAVDLGCGRRLVPDYYCLRHGASGKGNAIRSWELCAREREGDDWVVSISRDDDDFLGTL
jgi:hypothetical protein